MTVKPKKCAVCRKEFTPSQPMQKVCSLACALEVAKQKREKVDRADTRKRKLAIKSRAEWMKEAQAAFNRFIRLRDKDEPCISCGRHHTGQYHAGHYLSVGARPNLRFDEANVHKQCAVCNTYLSGNAILYRIALIDKIGLEEVERLESDQTIRKYTIDDLKEIIKKYKAKAKALE